ncbi:hypothetical protein [Streptomyces sp. NPDC020377]|uniref:hypothetical protein n=1 Tax=Streptomyces sp. NPDC020377 TaxID=3365070 RepID=UPI0037A4804E
MRGLSPTSATRTAVSDGVVEPSHVEVVLADVFDALTTLDYHFVSANTDEKKARQVKPPKPYPRRWLAQAAEDKGEKRAAKIQDARRRRKERQRAIDTGLIA